MPASATPVTSPFEAHMRAQRIFARLMAGESVRAIAASETLSVRRVQQIVRERLDRRNANPAEDFALLQIARLDERVNLGRQSAARSADGLRAVFFAPALCW